MKSRFRVTNVAVPVIIVRYIKSGSKGELRSMMHTFWTDQEQYESLYKEVERFIERVESRGLHE